MLLKEILDRDRLSDFLPVAAYDTEKKLYYCDKDSTAGFIIEVQPTYSASKSFYESIGAYLNAKWPKNALLQFILYADPNLDPILEPYRRQRGDKQDPAIAHDSTRLFLHQWANSYADYLESRKYSGIDSEEAPVCFRNFRCFCSAKIPCSEGAFATGSADLERLLENRSELMAGFKTCHMSADYLHPDFYLAFMYQLWNQGHPHPTYFPSVHPEMFTGEATRPLLKWDETRLISNQIINRDTIIVRRPRYIDIDGWKVCSKTLVGVPPSVDPLDINLFIGDTGKANKKQITTPFLLTLTVDANSQNGLVTRQGTVIMGQQAPLPGLRPRLEKRKNELLRANKLVDEGGKFVNGMLSISLFAKNRKKLESASAAVDAIWKQRGFTLQGEAGLNLPLFMFNQPLGGTTEMMSKFNRFFPAPTNSFSFLVPIQADSNSGGSGKPVFIFLSRRGQVVGHDLRDSPRDYNAFVAAPSGSGKSFFVNDLATNNFSIGGRNYVIDIGRSYEKLCRTMKGQYIEFTPNSDISLNIFSLITPELWLSDDTAKNRQDDADDDPKARLRETCEILLHQMVSPKEVINSNEKALLGMILGQCYDEIALDWRKKKLAESVAIKTLDGFLNFLEGKRDKFEANNQETPSLNDAEILPKEAFIAPPAMDDFFGWSDDEFDSFASQSNIKGLTVSKWLRSIKLYTVTASVPYSYFAEQVGALGRFLDSYMLGEKDVSEIYPLGYTRLQDLISNLKRTFLSERFFSLDMMIKNLNLKQKRINDAGQVDNLPGQLAQRLHPFSSAGKYAKWFQGKFNVEFTNPFVVLELEELAQFDDLKQVVMILVLSSIEHKIYITPDRSRPTLVIMDEAWDLLVGENTSNFIEKAYRRFRKYGASIITITQSIFDMVDKNKSVGMAVLNNSSWKFFLGPSEAEVERADEENIFPVSRQEKQLMVSAHTVRGSYSEIVYRDPYGVLRLGRLHVDKKTMLMFSTQPLEVELLEMVRRELKLDVWEAICASSLYLDMLHKTLSPAAVLEKIRADLSRQEEKEEIEAVVA